MTNHQPDLYNHRLKQDGTHDSICLACLATIATQKNEDALAREEEEHVCKLRLPAQRVRSRINSHIGEFQR